MIDAKVHLIFITDLEAKTVLNVDERKTIMIYLNVIFLLIILKESII